MTKTYHRCPLTGQVGNGTALPIGDVFPDADLAISVSSAAIWSKALEKLIERHDSRRLAGAGSSRSEILVLAHYDKPVHREVVQLELVVHVRLVLFQVVVSREELPRHEDGQFENGVEPPRDFSNGVGLLGRTHPSKEAPAVFCSLGTGNQARRNLLALFMGQAFSCFLEVLAPTRVNFARVTFDFILPSTPRTSNQLFKH